jgi:NAD(P)-dependent dehydrogenase (short-subunit alcohol dehydrogenase family)
VVVVVGAGGMGCAVARRIGVGSTVVFADVSEQSLGTAANALRADGYNVVSHAVDVSRKDSVVALAAAAAARGFVTAVVHTAGVSPVQATVDAILRVDLLGTALVLDAFGEVIGSGGAGVFIASMAGTMASLDLDLERRLATTPADRLLELPELSADAFSEPGTAYAVAKRANQVRVQAASLSWGRRGARVNSLSPGVIATSMGEAELDGPHGEIMRAMIAASATGRIGTPGDIAAAVDFLIGDDAAFVTGTDLLVDGGVIAALRNPAS